MWSCYFYIYLYRLLLCVCVNPQCVCICVYDCPYVCIIMRLCCRVGLDGWMYNKAECANMYALVAAVRIYDYGSEADAREGQE